MVEPSGLVGVAFKTMRVIHINPFRVGPDVVLPAVALPAIIVEPSGLVGDVQCYIKK